MTVPSATIRAMPGDLERLPATASATVPGAGRAAMAAELLAGCGQSSQRSASWGSGEQVLVSESESVVSSENQRLADPGLGPGASPRHRDTLRCQ